MGEFNNLKIRKKTTTILVAIYILLLIPVLYIGRYDYHCADDFGFSAAAHIAWEDTHSLISVFRAACETVVDRWNTWQGTFATMILMALEPGLFGDVYYHFVPWIMIGTMTASTMFLLHTILVEIGGCSKAIWGSASMIYLIFALECIVDPLQGFYWYNGAVHYMIPHSLAVILAGVLVKVSIGEKRIFLFILACIIAFFLGGSNYISALGTGVALGLTIIIAIFVKCGKNIAIYIVTTIFYLPAFLLNVLAPGNDIRQAAVGNHPSVIKAIALAFYFCIERACSIWLDWKVLLFILAFFPVSIIFVNNIREKYNFSFRNPLIVVFISFCFLASLFSPTSYVSGDAGGGRVENIIFLDYIFLLIGNEIYLIGWIDTKLQLINKYITLDVKKHTIMFCYCLFASTFLFCAGLTILRDENSFTSSAAIASVVSGEASRYGMETKARTHMICESDGRILEVPRFVETPYLLYMDDIVPDSNDWRNNSMARYYRIEQVISYSLD